VAGKGARAGAWLVAAAVVVEAEELAAEAADVLGDGDVEVGAELAEPLGAVQPATNNAEVPSSSPRLSNVTYPSVDVATKSDEEVRPLNASGRG
jgi:hypothetical protein